MTTNNDPAPLETLLAALPDVRARLTAIDRSLIDSSHQPTADELLHQLVASNHDVRSLLSLVDTLLAEREQLQPTRLTEIEYETILSHVEHMVSEQYAKDSPMYNGEGFEDILGELVELGRIRETNDDYGYIYYIPASARMDDDV